MEYNLRFDSKQVEQLAKRYSSEQTQKEREAESSIENVIVPAACQSGCYTRADFLFLCEWKTPRTKRRCAQNDEEFVAEVTRLALTTTTEKLRIKVLTLLDGVGWPTASVLLHFSPVGPYPILDFRALWSLSIPEPTSDYNFPFWWEYVQICRTIADDCRVEMRTLDRALWQYSADHQT